MVAHRLVSEHEMQNSLVNEQAPKLWTQLTPDLRRRLTQHWAKLIQKIRQSILDEEEHDDWG